MPMHLTCPQGHQWDVADGKTTDIADARVACPVCGAAPSPSEAATVPPAPTAPPGSVPAADSWVTSETVPPLESSPATTLPEWPTIPGYEILGELGRGGMGVVYKARQIKADRLVALKMILTGGHAGEQALARFRSEAQAVAQLQHPNIVQIFEVGDDHGLPYFSLEFCPGGSLEKKLAGTPLLPLEAARLIETLTHAMQAAHDKGIVHRDLKPANVLLVRSDAIHGVQLGSSPDESGHYEPKITDFGLAKRLETPGHTATGAVMGTPSYMAPEQAARGKPSARQRISTPWEQSCTSA